MKIIGSYEARTRWSRLLNEVASGETIVITRRGLPIAELRSTAMLTSADLAAKAVEEWIEYRERHNITSGGLSLKEMIEEGRM